MPAPSVVMQCPFCARELTASDATSGGRYGCPDCAPTLEEAKKGWLPVARVAKTPDAARPHGLTRAESGWFAKHASSGEPISRQSTCECGVTFNQFLLSARFLATVEKQRGRALEMIKKQIPGYYVPVHCPKCERVDIGRHARLADPLAPAPHYTERDEAAD